MIETVFHTDDLLPGERLDYWRTVSDESLLPAMIVSESDAFHARLRMLDLGSVQLSSVTCSPLQARRTPALVRQSDPETFQLALTVRGTQGIAQSGRNILLGPQDMVAYGSWHPFHATASTPSDLIELVVVQIPRVLLPAPVERIDSLLMRPISGRTGNGTLFTQFVTRILTDAKQYRPADTPGLAATLYSLLGALVAHELDLDTAPEPPAGESDIAGNKTATPHDAPPVRTSCRKSSSPTCGVRLCGRNPAIEVDNEWAPTSRASSGY